MALQGHLAGCLPPPNSPPFNARYAACVGLARLRLTRFVPSVARACCAAHSLTPPRGSDHQYRPGHLPHSSFALFFAVSCRRELPRSFDPFRANRGLLVALPCRPWDRHMRCSASVTSRHGRRFHHAGTSLSGSVVGCRDVAGGCVWARDVRA